jgi:uncharacterized protein
MADHPNAVRSREAYEAFSSGDMAKLQDYFDPNIVWHVPGNNPLSGDYKGFDQVMEFFGKLMQETGGTFKLDVHDILANDEHTVALVEATAERNGKRLSQKVAHVFHQTDGKVTEFWGFAEDTAVGDEFFS